MGRVPVKTDTRSALSANYLPTRRNYNVHTHTTHCSDSGRGNHTLTLTQDPRNAGNPKTPRSLPAPNPISKNLAQSPNTQAHSLKTPPGSSRTAPCPRNCNAGPGCKKERAAASLPWGVRRGRCVNVSPAPSPLILPTISHRATGLAPVARSRRDTHMVKQSYMKLNAAGPTTVATSSGIGGAWFRLPNL